MNFLKNFADASNSKEIKLQLKNIGDNYVSENEAAKIIASTLNQTENVTILTKNIMELSKEPGSIKNDLKFYDQVISHAESKKEIFINRSKFKEFLSNSLNPIEVMVNRKINSKTELDIKLVIGLATLISHLFLNDLITFKVIYKWCQNVLISQKNCFVRRTSLEIIKDKVKGLISEKSPSNIAKLYDAIKKEGLFDELCEMPKVLSYEER